MLSLLREKLTEVVQAVGPLVGAICVLLIALVDEPAPIILQFMAGSALVVAGMVLLFAGLELGILPMGRFVGAALPN
jgi:hypothetical protein